MSDDFHSRADAIESELDELLSPEELVRIREAERASRQLFVDLTLAQNPATIHRLALSALSVANPKRRPYLTDAIEAFELAWPGDQRAPAEHMRTSALRALPVTP